MRWLRLIFLSLNLLFVGGVLAQEDFSWLTSLLPTGADININKQLLQGTVPIDAASEVLNEGFSAVNAWDTIQDRDGYRRIRDERYEMLLRTSGAIYTGLSSSSYSDTVISVDSIHLSAELNDGYGLVCRASGWENSYHFYISGDGYYRIAVYEDGRARGLTDWTASDLIQQGVDAINSMTAVCVGDYLALYINGSLATEVHDSTLSTGSIGMVVILFTAESEVHIGFDNLRVWEAASGGIVLPTPAPTILNTDEERAALERRTDTAEQALALGNLRFAESFDDAARWNPIANPEGTMAVGGGVLQANTEGSNVYPIITLSHERYDNGVFTVKTHFTEGAANTAYSLICRGSETGSLRGYYFNISADGFYSVWASDGEAFRYVVAWDRSLAINLEGANQLTVVCVDDYFAFYVNETLLSEFYDDLYTEGTIGMSILGYEGAAGIAFDDLLVWDADLE